MASIPARRKINRPFSGTPVVTQAFAHILGAEPTCYDYGNGLYGFSWKPGASRNNWHLGVDYGLSCGTPLLAPADGVVHSAGWDDTGFGYLTVLDHGSGLLTFLAHQQRIDVDAGQHVSVGQSVGQSGTSGNSSGCHLHFATATPDGLGYYDFFDPAPFILYNPEPTGGPTAAKYVLLVDMLLRTKPAKDAPSAVLVRRGANVTADDGWTTNWRRVKTADGHEGWLFAPNLQAA